MANIEATSDAYKIYHNGRWGSWRPRKTEETFLLELGENDRVAIRIPAKDIKVTQVKISEWFVLDDQPEEIGADIIAGLYGTDPESGAEQAKTVYSNAKSGSHEYIISGANIEATGYIYIVFSLSAWVIPSLAWSPEAKTAVITYSEIPLTVEVLTPTVYLYGSAQFSFAESRNGATVSVTPYFGTTTPLDSTINVDKDTFSIPTKPSWFTAAGITSDSMRVTLRCSDTLGRSNTNASFTLNRYGALTPTIVKPRSGQADAAGEIEFQWANSGEGEQVEFAARWSTDQSNWIDMTPPQLGSETSFITEAGLFPAGVIYWQVRVLDRDTGWSKWVQASFTAVYNVATVTLLTPTSGTVQGNTGIIFNWSISDNGGTITGTQMEISRDSGITWTRLLNQNFAVTSYTSSIGQFAAGELRWRVRAKNEYQTEYADNWATATITIAYTAASITLITPTSGQRDGSGEIPFAWNITNGSGNIVKTIMEVSTDDGLSWTEKVNKNEKATSYTASAAEFPAGALKWRVKTKNQYQDDYTVSSTGNVTIVYSAVSQISSVNSPTSGRIPASVNQSFAVALTPSAPVYSPFTIHSATMYWRAGTSGDYTAVQMTASGANATVTIPGGTFPSGTIQWYAEAVDNTGATRTTDVYTLLALNASVEAVPLSPINTIEGTSSEITFTWLYYSLDGTAQSRALLEYSRDGESWDTIADVPGSDTTYTAPAGFFTSAGTVYWRVQAFNASGTAGPKSAAVSFTLFGSSSVASVIGDGKPFATVRWQAEGQVSYELMIGDKHIGPYFGADVRSYTLAEPLEDGVYTIKVRIQNKYGIWSDWAAAEMSVQNQPGSGYVNIFAEAKNTIVLTIHGKPANMITQQPRDIQTTDPQLAKISCTFTKPWGPYSYNVQELLQGSVSWENVRLGFGDNDDTEYTAEYLIKDPSQHNGSLFRFVIGDFETTSRTAKYTYAEPYKQTPDITGRFWPETGYFLIYRDDKLIAKTHENVFEDRSALGTHRYSVVQALTQGFYLRSNVVTVSAFVKSPLIAPLAGGDFIELSLSPDADRAQDIQRSREVLHVHYSGSRFPTAEIGEAETMSVSFDTAWKQTDRDAADAFEALVGEDVILKTPGGYVIVGTLEGYDLHNPRFYKSFRCALQQGDWRDFVNVT